jgi:hypothetical protein
MHQTLPPPHPSVAIFAAPVGNVVPTGATARVEAGCH